MKKVTLAMIVKDEAHCIERCLDSVKDFVDYYWIQDTGSTDRTKGVIHDWMRKNHIGDIGVGFVGSDKNGYIIHSQEWQGFDVNRTSSLSDARLAFPKAEYLLMIDADEVIVWKDKNALKNAQKLKDSLSCDIYDIRTVMGTGVYTRPQLTAARKAFTYKGVMHEFLDDSQDKIETRGIIEDFVNTPIQDSARNKNPDKFKNDAIVLSEALKTESDPMLCSRYVFYLAQCLKDSHDIPGALHNYQKRTTMGGWPEEIYWSYYQAAKMKEQLGYESEDIIQTLMKAYEVVPYRAEVICEAARISRENGWHHQAYILSKFALPIKMPPNSLFTEADVYSYRMLDEFSIAAYYTGRYKESKDICELILKEKKYPKEEARRIQKNLDFANEGLNNE